ncbi:hypothetical protein BPOR_0249g00090 [Botrytis porri]|uniref:Uncharacterized protein n=1 Tax=Botrytis porri TaxID=87229 RepID=A0A4Z1KT82_9HELO|nr:hypothetical protein BPOR_0249g00090 [Botrytis porri]
MELIRNVVEVYADQVFKGDTYEEFMGAIVDQLLIVHDKDAALRDGKLIALRMEGEDNMKKQTDADTERSEQLKDGRKSDEKVKDLLEEVEKKFWEDE